MLPQCLCRLSHLQGKVVKKIKEAFQLKKTATVTEFLNRMPNIDLEIIPSQMGFLKGSLCPAYAPLIVQVLTCAFHVGMKSGIVGRTGHLPRLLDCFLTFSGYTRLLRFDMDDGAITISLPCGRKFGYWEGPFWVMPNCEPQVKKEVPKVGNYKTEIIKESWNNLPAELLELVISSLFLGDCIRFRLTCKSLIFIMPQMRPNPPLTQCESRCQHIPWLMSLQKNNSAKCIFYYHIYEKCATCRKMAYPLEKDEETPMWLIKFLYAIAAVYDSSKDAEIRAKDTASADEVLYLRRGRIVGYKIAVDFGSIPSLKKMQRSS
ncbi:hypothetical protein IFM89_011401 [Coptis chinensis]|uniref:F-box domain-containing protein n=1 Tax=Coptis chinensis TaxID=261450 RepID=A0A835LRE8_9MAGN|nr:hypothetical protein IFM89_011401 [Coptis chinensis]